MTEIEVLNEILVVLKSILLTGMLVSVLELRKWFKDIIAKMKGAK